MKKSLGLSCLALAGLFALTGCSVSEKDGKAWAEENGYIKYTDSHTQASSNKESSYRGMYEEKQALADAINNKQGIRLITTINEDGTTNVGYFMWRLVKVTGSTDEWEIQVSFGPDKNKQPDQTTKNLLRTGKGTAIYMSHSGGEIVGDKYTAVTQLDVAPQFAASTYYKKEADNTTYTLLTEAPADWASKYATYFTKDGEDYNPVEAVKQTPTWEAKKYYSKHGDDEYVLTTEAPGNWSSNYADYYTKSPDTVDLKLDKDHNVAVAAQVNFHVKSSTKVTTPGTWEGGYSFVLAVDSFEPIS